MESYIPAKLELIAIEEDVITASVVCWFCYDEAVTVITITGPGEDDWEATNYSTNTEEYMEYCG